MASRLLEPARVQAAAQPVHLGRLLASVLLSICYALGWLAAQVVRGISIGLGYGWASMKLGWSDVYTKGGGRAGPG